MTRAEEVKKLLAMTPEEMLEKAKGRLIILDTLDDLHQHFARSIADEIKGNNEEGKPTRLILPVGPTGQYPILAEIINRERISLKNCWFFFMDEYCDDSGKPVPPDHPLSFKGEMRRLLFDRIDPELNIPEERIIFPSLENLPHLKDMIEEVGGIDTCYGGIGIHGHVAFNEPEPNVRHTDPRIVYLNEYTITINAIRAKVGGDLVNFPRKAITLGMNQIMGARRVRLYCRNDIPGIDWANLVLRLAVFGTPGDDYPVTYLTEHPDYVVITTKDTAAVPENILPLPY